MAEYSPHSITGSISQRECTTDGENPATSSDQYAAAIAIGETTTIKAFAVMSGMIDSEIASATYTIALPSIVGEWLIDQTYQAYYDSPPTTVSHTQNFTMIMNADETFTGSGTSKWENQPQANVESTGTYTYDEVAGTLEMVHTTILVDGNPMDFPAATYDCEITETTMTLTYPLVTAYFPAEPLIYTRQ